MLSQETYRTRKAAWPENCDLKGEAVVVRPPLCHCGKYRGGRCDGTFSIHQRAIVRREWGEEEGGYRMGWAAYDDGLPLEPGIVRAFDTMAMRDGYLRGYLAARVAEERRAMSPEHLEAVQALDADPVQSAIFMFWRHVRAHAA